MALCVSCYWPGAQQYVAGEERVRGAALETVTPQQCDAIIIPFRIHVIQRDAHAMLST